MKKTLLAACAAFILVGSSVSMGATPEAKIQPIKPESTGIKIQVVVAMTRNGNLYPEKNKICHKHFKQYIGKTYIPYYTSLNSGTIALYSQDGAKTILNNRSFAGYDSFSTFSTFDGADRTYYIVKRGDKNPMLKLFFNYGNYQCVAMNAGEV